MRKSLVVLLLAIMLVISTACGSANSTTNTKGNNDKAGNNQATSEQSGSSNESITLRLHSWYPKQGEYWDKVIAEYERLNPNIKIDFVSAEDNNSQEFYKKLDLAAASGDELDIIMFSAMVYHSQRAELGMLEPLNDFLEKDGVNLAEEYSIDTAIGDTVYGLPGKLVPFLVYINEEHLKEAGLELPKKWTWDEYMQYAKAMTKTENGKTRYGTYFHSWASFTYLLQNLNDPENANLAANDGSKATINTPLVRKTLELRLQGEKEGSATPYSEVVSQKLNYRPQYFNQETSMIPMGSFLIAEVGGTEQVPATFKTVFAPNPTVNEGDPISVNTGSDILGVYSKPKHKEEAYKFIRWFTTEGIVLQGNNIPSWKKADMKKVLDTIIAKTKTPEMIDKESLLYVLENTEFTTPGVPVPFHSELEKVFTEEFDKMMLSGQDLDTTIQNAQERAQKIVESKK